MYKFNRILYHENIKFLIIIKNNKSFERKIILSHNS